MASNPRPSRLDLLLCRLKWFFVRPDITQREGELIQRLFEAKRLLDDADKMIRERNARIRELEEYVKGSLGFPKECEERLKAGAK